VPQIDWDNPISGNEVPSLDVAERAVPFEVRAPKGLGQPTKHLMSPSSFHAGLRVVASLFDSPEYGRVIVIQHLPDLPVEEYHAANRSLVEMNGQPNVSGSAEILSIRGGLEALVTTSEDKTKSTVFWLENGVEYVVEGPHLDRSEVLRIAEGI
jgi:hypothetical protein